METQEGFEGKGLPFYRCILCGTVVNVWDIKGGEGCPKCKNRRIKPTNLSFWEMVMQIFKHPAIWKWKDITI
jgi:NAD-dependent SIR2 family protein deacetylase